MIWSDEFKQRVLFNASKAYVKQLGKSKRYELLQPVYSLNLVNEVFEEKKDRFLYNYHIVCDEDTNLVIDGLHLTFVELPKFKPQTLADKKMMALWLRFLTEIDEQTVEAAPELLADAHIKQALDLVEHSAFTDDELDRYDKFWDIIRTEQTLISSSEKKGRAEGIVEGIYLVAKNLKQMGMSISEIAKATKLTEDEINKL